MKIQVINQTVENVPTANGGYNKMVVTFKNLDNGKIEVKTLMDFNDKQVFARLEEAKANEVFDVVNKKKPGKDGKEYWNWVEVTRYDGEVPEAPKAGGPVAAKAPGAAVPAPKSTYETAEERALRQLLIVRQSSLAQAILFHKDQGGKPTVDDVLSLATRFDEWVWNKGIAGMSSDIPE